MEKQFEELLTKVKDVVADAVKAENTELAEKVKAFEASIEALQKAQDEEEKTAVFSFGSKVLDEQVSKCLDRNSYAKSIMEDMTDEEEKKQFSQDLVAHTFIKALARNDYETIKELSATNKDLTEGTDSEGGYLVPAPLQNKVYKLLTSLGLVRKEMTIIKMTSSTLDLSTIAAKPTVYWVAEGAQITASDPAFGRKTITAKKIAGIAVMSNELLEDSGVDVINLYIDLIAEGIANEEDKSFFNTHSSGDITGLLEDTGVNLVTMDTGDDAFSNVDYDNLVDVTMAVHPRERKSAKWCMNGDIIGYVAKLKTTTNLPVWSDAIAGQPAKLLGYPVLENPQMPDSGDSAASTKFLVFGNFKRYIVGIRRGFTAKILDEATVNSINLAEKDERAVRITQRIGGVTPTPDAFAVLKTGATS